MWFPPKAKADWSSDMPPWHVITGTNQNPIPSSIFPLMFLYTVMKIPLHVKRIAAADGFASFPFLVMIHLVPWHVIYTLCPKNAFPQLGQFSRYYYKQNPPYFFIYHNKPQIRPRRPRLARAKTLDIPELAYVDVELLTIVLLEYTTPPPLFLPTQ